MILHMAKLSILHYSEFFPRGSTWDPQSIVFELENTSPQFIVDHHPFPIWKWEIMKKLHNKMTNSLTTSFLHNKFYDPMRVHLSSFHFESPSVIDVMWFYYNSFNAVFNQCALQDQIILHENRATQHKSGGEWCNTSQIMVPKIYRIHKF